MKTWRPNLARRTGRFEGAKVEKNSFRANALKKNLKIAGVPSATKAASG
jgi:hypothetical protein